MRNSVFFNFLFLLIYRHRSKHLAVFVISAMVVMLLASVMLVTESIERDVKASLASHPDFIVQKMHAGKSVDAPLEWIYALGEIEGVSAVVPRVYGTYLFAPNNTRFTIVGIDLFDRQISDALEKVVEGIDARTFLEKDQMIVGPGVKAVLDQFYFTEHYLFRGPGYTPVPVQILETLPEASAMVANDMAIMPIGLARKILGIGEEYASDIAIYAPNELEHDNIRSKIILSQGGVRVIEKRAMARAYEQLFNYQSGLFLLLFLIVLVTFVIVLYQRYSMISSSDKKEIGILRSLGWSIAAVIRLKVMESFVVALGAFLSGFLLAYLYVFGLDAPFLAEIFTGSGNLPMEVTFTHGADFGTVSLLFLFFVLPFVAAVLIPVWRIAITDPVEAMK